MQEFDGRVNRKTAGTSADPATVEPRLEGRNDAALAPASPNGYSVPHGCAHVGIPLVARTRREGVVAMPDAT
jgi:hypothetical protein